ncbi:hypothetical protein V8E54_004939 [Elaphomyces granulatus]
MPKKITSQQIVRERLPDLRVGHRHTTSKAFRKIRFLGNLRHWDSFERDVWQVNSAHPWGSHQKAVSHAMQNPSNAHLSWEQVFCGDEHGVQGRFQERVGQVMTGVFTDQGMDLSFGDFKASIPRAYIDSGHDLVAIMTDPDSLRNALGQIAKDMRSTRSRHGFLSTYDHTIFLRQTHSLNWVLEYSSVINQCGQIGPNLVSGMRHLAETTWQTTLRQKTNGLVDSTCPGQHGRRRWAMAASGVTSNDSVLTGNGTMLTKYARTWSICEAFCIPSQQPRVRLPHPHPLVGSPVNRDDYRTFAKDVELSLLDVEEPEEPPAPGTSISGAKRTWGRIDAGREISSSISSPPRLGQPSHPAS